MGKFKNWFIWLTAGYLALIILLFLFYGFQVKDGNWGSFSDVIIAVFTILISYSTTLLLVAAYLTASNWLHEKRHDFAWDFMKKLSELYFLMHSKRSTSNKIDVLKDIEGTQLKDKIRVISEVRGLISYLGAKIDWSTDEFSEQELLSYKHIIIAYRKDLQDKFRETHNREAHLKFEVLTAANVLNNELTEGGVDIMKEVRNLTSLKSGFHKFGSNLFINVSKAIGLKEHKIILIGEPPIEYPPLKDFDND